MALSGIIWTLRFLAGAAAFVPVDMAVWHFSTRKSTPKVEAAGGILFLICGAFFGYGSWGLLSLKGLAAFIYLGILMAAALIDWNTGKIYDCFSAGIILLGIVSIRLFPEHGLWERLAGVLAVAAPMLFFTLIMRDAFGGGDIKLMAAGGFWLGWRGVLAAAVIGLLGSGFYCAWMLALKKLTVKDSFALGPFLAAGLGAAFFGEDFLMAAADVLLLFTAWEAVNSNDIFPFR